MNKKMTLMEIKEKSKLTKEEWREYTKTVWYIANISDKKHPAVFPEEIPNRLIKLFTFWGETVLDPFAGIGTTAISSLKNNRNVISIDQNKDYIKEIKKNVKHFQTSLKELNENGNKYPKIKSKVIAGDSREILKEIEENSINLIVTSPPYWNKADYGGNSENLGNIENYNNFLVEMKKVFKECFRVLQPGRKICIVTANVNQYTDYGLLTFPIASDFTNSLREIGFVMINEIIWSKDGTGGKWGSYGKQRPIFGSYPYPPNLLFKNIHEYVLIFAKPGNDRKNGKKVKILDELL